MIIKTPTENYIPIFENKTEEKNLIRKIEAPNVKFVKITVNVFKGSGMEKKEILLFVNSIECIEL